jgi:gliding motility-associated-like protein
LKIGGSTKNCYVSYPDTTNGDTMFFIDIYAYDTTKVLAKPMKVCLGDTITFTGNVKPLGRYTSYVWNYGITRTDTSILKDTVTKKVYATPGKYTVKFMGDVTSAPTTGKICAMQDSVIVEVQGVTADFDVDSTRKPIFCFNNTSKASSGNVINNRWSFYNPVDLMSLPTVARVFIPNGKNTGDYNNPQICEDYRDSLGAYWVCLEAESDNGCKDTVCKRIFNNFKAIVRPPNVFTPNGKFDGKDDEGLVGNEVFNILIEGEDKYDLVIYDRWGVKVFESSDKTNDWNGKVKNTGAECPDGTYYYILKYRYKGIDKDEPILNGIVKIIR